jgi:hypothetical protein
MSTLKHSWGLVGLATVLGLLFLVAIIGAINIWAGPTSAATGWTPLFADSFTSTTVSLWTVSDTVGGAFHWDIVPYTRTLGTVMIGDSGFWAAGGGSLGGTLTWPEGTYANNMTTWAVAGPFTPTRKVWGVRLRFRVQNRVAPSDTLFVGLSYDNVHFTGITLTEAFTDWREMTWSAPVYTDGLPIWVMLRFASDGDQVDVGPLVDNLSLEVNYGYEVYLPLVRKDPTPTPTVTPVPSFYRDDFDDPMSGWYTGTAERYNHRLDPDRWVTEVVAYMDYEDGHHTTYIPLTAHGGGDVDTWFVWPAHAAPLPAHLRPIPDNYCIEVRGILANSQGNYDPWWAHWGIVFGANESFTNLYTFQINANRRWAVIRYPTYVYPGDRTTDNETKIREWGQQDLPEILGGPKYNTLKVVVQGSSADYYVNGVRLGGGHIGNFPRAKIGLIAGDWEVTPVDIWIDYFHYDPDCPEAHQSVTR